MSTKQSDADDTSKTRVLIKLTCSYLTISFLHLIYLIYDGGKRSLNECKQRIYISTFHQALEYTYKGCYESMSDKLQASLIFPVNGPLKLLLNIIPYLIIYVNKANNK